MSKDTLLINLVEEEGKTFVETEISVNQDVFVATLASVIWGVSEKEALLAVDMGTELLFHLVAKLNEEEFALFKTAMEFALDS